MAPGPGSEASLSQSTALDSQGTHRFRDVSGPLAHSRRVTLQVLILKLSHFPMALPSSASRNDQRPEPDIRLVKLTCNVEIDLPEQGR